MSPEPTPEYVSQSDAADLSGVSLDTIKRDRRGGRYPGARREAGSNGAWQIPVADLVAAGRLIAEEVPAGRAVSVAREARLDRDSAILRAEIEHLRAELEQVRTALGKAERQLEEERRVACDARAQVVTLAGRIADLTTRTAA